jgi:hypothetical protein
MRALSAIFFATMTVTLPGSATGQMPPCTVGMVEGTWVFATGIGQLSNQPPIPEPARGKQITAIGTIHIDGQGNISGAYDNTIADVGSFLNNTFVGTVVVNADCTGTLSFTDSRGASRTDSIVVLTRRDQSELWGMSRDHLLVWTYTARRISF